jgi:UbiA prenyltransferase family
MNFRTLWTYQKERFPLIKTAPLLAVFSAASISVSAELAGRPLPASGAFAAGFAVAMLLFFQMRVCDEYKDLDDDQRFRPDRPIPRGLISLKAVLTMGLASLPLTAFAVLAWHPPLVWLLIVVWLWLAVMTIEFGVPQWLKARPVLYLISHMAIMPLIDLLLTAIEWMPVGPPATGLALFFALSFVNGCVLEIGRKLWAPDSEIAGVDTYSRLWGTKKAATVWGICVMVSFGLLTGVGAATGVFWITLVIGGAAAVACLAAVMNYARAPTLVAEKRMDMLAGLWVFACYSLAGFAPLAARMM